MLMEHTTRVGRTQVRPAQHACCNIRDYPSGSLLGCSRNLMDIGQWPAALPLDSLQRLLEQPFGTCMTALSRLLDLAAAYTLCWFAITCCSAAPVCQLHPAALVALAAKFCP